VAAPAALHGLARRAAGGEARRPRAHQIRISSAKRRRNHRDSPSETVLQRKLELAHRSSRLDDPKQWAPRVRAGQIPGRMVEEIKCLKPELQSVPFSDSEVLRS